MLGIILLGFVGFVFIHQASIAVYNLYFHPLASIPGIKRYVAFPVLRWLAAVRGDFDKTVREAHARHGSIVRYSNDAVSFITAQAWKDIYGYSHNGQPQWQRLQALPGTVKNIIFADDEDHSRFRKALSHAFSERGLQKQEPIIKYYIDMLIEKLKLKARHNEPVDMTNWYNLTTFDIISDLAFGETSDCLKNGVENPYFSLLFGFIQALVWLRLAQHYPVVWAILRRLTGKSADKNREKMQAFSRSAVTRRLEDPSRSGRGDFMDSMLKHRGDPKLHITDEELGSNATLLFIAGSETTATLLAGVTYYLCMNPKVLARVTEEVRSQFDKEEHITFTTASARLPYMLACLEETLRLYPPVPTILARVTPPNTVSTVDGQPLPPNTQVGVHQTAANWSPANFHLPKSFIPERWLSEVVADEKSPFHNDNRDVRQPFSYGPRNCIGRNLAFSEMRQILARVLWNFDLQLVDQDCRWDDQISHALWVKGKLMVRLTERARESEKEKETI